ncbi:reverse transcriptase domain-containing protein [uncultured Sphaerochaeta sp.]|uniref:reverse transcriptase domain-containing protein n=1 Tax=uncultured Sphaerochaeta sp. TaxID=886478 RepID=UPI002A0A594B|nr:reverse transcriptase domain-containing protein [uncultured Sphaerochaeta sp.]
MRHLNYEFTVHLDFAHFFPSVSSNMLFRSLQIQNIELDDYDQSIIQKICFRNTNMSYYLSIGSPTSPIISNIIMKEFDDYFMGYAARYSSSYTRYADDLWFSTNSYKQRNDFCNDVTDYLKRNDWLLQINQQKTYFSRKNQAHHIAGLVITEKQEIKVPRKIKRYIRSLLFDKDFDFDKKQILNGYISYIRDNEPSYLNNLIKKYGKVYYKKIIQEN